MSRHEFRAAFREARKLLAFQRAFAKTFEKELCSLHTEIPSEAFQAACRYGDRLKYQPFRVHDRLQSRVSGKYLRASASPTGGAA